MEVKTSGKQLKWTFRSSVVVDAAGVTQTLSLSAGRQIFHSFPFPRRKRDVRADEI